MIKNQRRKKRKDETGSGKAAKKQKVQEPDPLDFPPLWTTFDEIPPEPPRDMVQNGYTYDRGEQVPYFKDRNKHVRDKFKEKLTASLTGAVQEGNRDFVRRVLETKRTRDLLHILKHSRLRGYGDAMDHILEMNGKELPLQPDFGFQGIMAGSTYDWRHKNLFVEAIKHNQFEMVKELDSLGFDINANLSGYQGNNHNCALLEAVRKGNREIIHYLVERPHILLTNPSTTFYRHGNSRSRPRCEPTALSMAAERGMKDVVELLIAKGALDFSSARRSDDTRPMRKGDAQDLVSLSVKEAMVEAYDRAAEESHRGHEEYAGVLETLVRETGKQERNAIAIIILDRIKRNDWSDIPSECAYCYSYCLENDRDFDRATGKPGARALAIARGLRPPCPGSKVDLKTKSSIRRMEEKRQQWSEIVQVCRERLVDAGSNWIVNLIQDAIERRNRSRFPFHNFDVKEAYQRVQMLFWCQLFTTAPWSRALHWDYFPPATRTYVRELVDISSRLDRRLDRVLGYTGALKEIWDREIIPYVIE